MIGTVATWFKRLCIAGIVVILGAAAIGDRLPSTSTANLQGEELIIRKLDASIPTTTSTTLPAKVGTARPTAQIGASTAGASFDRGER